MSRTITALTITTAALASVAPAAAHGPERLAPGGNITAVVKATQKHGWPHPPTNSEVRVVAHLALWYGVHRDGRAGAVFCSFGPRSIGRVRCTVTREGKRQPNILFRIFEDGSYFTVRR